MALPFKRGAKSDDTGFISEAAHRQMLHFLKQHTGLVERVVSGDGSCLLHALYKALGYDTTRGKAPPPWVKAMRRLAQDFVNDNPAANLSNHALKAVTGSALKAVTGSNYMPEDLCPVFAEHFKQNICVWHPVSGKNIRSPGPGRGVLYAPLTEAIRREADSRPTLLLAFVASEKNSVRNHFVPFCATARR
jgi:hypothetical protein